MTTIDSTYNKPWLDASTTAALAIGSCTLLIICQAVVPDARAASTDVGDTPRMPSAISLVATGTPNATAATIAVNRLVPNSASAGTR